MEKFQSEVLALLSEDARYSAKQMATMLSREEAEVAAAVSALEKSGVIAGYSVVVNDERLAGDSVVDALIEVKVTPQRSKGFDAIAQQINSFPEVKSLYLMSGGFDLAVFIRGKSLKEVALFVSEKLSLIENITGTATHFILKKYKIEGITTGGGDIKRIPFSYEL